MKNKTFIFLISSLFISPLFSFADISIEWTNSDDYRDASYNDMNTSKSRRIVLKDLEKYIQRRAEVLLPEGIDLELSFTEVDLAGDFEPFRRGGMDEVRIIKSIYPAGLHFSYKLKKLDTFIDEGEVKLKHKMLSKPMGYGSENYVYSKDLMNEWLKALLRSLEA